MEEENIENEVETSEINQNGVKDSILNDTKKSNGLSEDNTSFDSDIIILINSAFMILNQLGVGPETGFRISDSSTTWSEYIKPEDDLEAVKTYIHLKVKLVFDPPLSSTVMEAYKQAVAELEWRLNVNAESKGG